MSRKRPLPVFDHANLCRASADDRFGRIYEGMLRHAKWAELSPASKILYVVAVTHTATALNYRTLKWYREKNGLPEKDFSDGTFFILTQEQLREYGINTHRYSERFAELCRSGFIETIHSNAHRKMPNLYRLSGGWKEKP